MKLPKSLPWIAIVLILLAAGGIAYWFWPPPATEQATEEAGPTEAVPVQTAKAELQTLRPSLDLTGILVAVPEKTASVSSQLGGWVEKLGAVEGQHITAGSPIAYLDTRTAKTDLQRTGAIVAEKEAVLARLKRGYLPQEIEAARQDRDKARAAMEALQGEVAALKDLRKRNEISAVQFENKQKLLAQAEAAFAAADAHGKLIEQGTPTELIAEAEAFLTAAKADYEHAQLALEWCEIKSPIDGVIVHLLARQGQFFDRAAPLATVMDLSEVFVQLRIPSSEFARIRQGTPVDVEMTGDRGRKFAGKVARIGGQADLLTGSIDVFVAIKNEVDLLLRPGLSCRARIWLPEIPDAVVRPSRSRGGSCWHRDSTRHS